MEIKKPKTNFGKPIDGAIKRVLAKKKAEESKSPILTSSEFNNEQRARKISKAIEDNIGFDRGLVENGVRDSRLCTSPNAGFAILDYLLGNEQRARNIRKAIEENIGFNRGLVKNMVGDFGLYTFSNAEFGILNLAQRLKEKKK